VFQKALDQGAGQSDGEVRKAVSATKVSASWRNKVVDWNQEMPHNLISLLLKNATSQTTSQMF
jgi:hypothetical protein